MTMPDTPKSDDLNDTAQAARDSGNPETIIDELTAAPAEPAPPIPSIQTPVHTEATIPPAKGSAKKEEGWGETIKTVIYALLIALVIRTFLFQPFNIPSGSMENTLLVGDYLFVEKFAYGYSRFSMPFGDMVPSIGRVFGSVPNRGDVIVFKFPPDESTDYIKRLIGLPGDRIQMLNGQLYINDKAVPKVRVADYQEPDGFGGVNAVRRYQETLPNGKSYFVLDRDPDGPGDNTDVYIVPAGHYFMMGDNRDNSADSRTAVGYVPAENLVGKAELIFFSIDDSATWYEPWTWPAAIRFSRIPTIID
jgi:signal peptidase I